MKILPFFEEHKFTIAIFLLLIYLSNTSPILSPQKEISFSSPGTYKFVQTGGGVVALSSLLKFIGPWGFAIGTLLIAGPWVFSSWKDLFAPTPTIPTWVIIGAFAVLIMIIFKKK